MSGRAQCAATPLTQLFVGKSAGLSPFSGFEVVPLHLPAPKKSASAIRWEETEDHSRLPRVCCRLPKHEPDRLLQLRHSTALPHFNEKPTSWVG